MDTIGQCLGLLFMLISIFDSEAGNHTEYKHVDVDAERDLARIYGVCVGVVLSCMFLVVLCISFTYYRHKSGATVYEEEPPKYKEVKKSVTTLNKEMQNKLKQIDVTDSQVAPATQDTRF